ncbi:unnamed protein product [Cochlearia groenlandica]
MQAEKSDMESTKSLLQTLTLDPSSDSSSSNTSKSRCSICLNETSTSEGKAIFTAECSHSFHFDCVTSNAKLGNKICPTCRTQWKQVPLLDSVVESTLPSQRCFEDDEFLPHGETQLESSIDSGVARQALEVNLFPQVSAVAKEVTRGDFAVLVHLKAESVSDDNRPTRAPIDLITVLDVSGSMHGMKLALMKRAMSFVIQNLGEKDRLSVVSFSGEAHRVFPLRLMTETGKQDAIQAVKSLVAGGRTNIADGLKIGSRVIEDRRMKNPVSGMMLLSDGKDNYTLSRRGNNLRIDYESLLPNSSRRIPIHTFGFGSDHDAELMHTISQVSSGTFTFIESEIAIQDAFALCIGGLLSVVTLEQVVEIECLDDQRLNISSIKAGSYINRLSSDGRRATIDVGDMYADEERDFIVILEIPRSAKSLLKVRCVYKDAVTREIVRVESGEVIIERPDELTGEEVVSIEVDRQLNRFLVAQAMSEAKVLADGGDLNAAVEILGKCLRDLSETLSARSKDTLCESLSSDLSVLRERMTSERVYKTSGRAYALCGIGSYSVQRGMACGMARGVPKVGSVAYRTPAMGRMLKKSQQQGIQSPVPSAPAPEEKKRKTNEMGVDDVQGKQVQRKRRPFKAGAINGIGSEKRNA